MNCFRRAALRAASAQTAQTARTAIVSKRVVPVLAAVPAMVAKSTALPLARAFSVSRTLANVEEDSGNSTSQEESAELKNELHPEEPPNGVFVRNLVFDATDEHLVEAFSQYGKVIQGKIARDARGLSRGYGFIYYEQPEEALKALEEANNTFWHGRRITVAARTKEDKPRKSRQQTFGRPPSEHLYIGNIPYETTDAELNKFFSSLENLKDVRIAVDRSTGWPRGFAHADFHDVESATKAAEQIKTMELMGRPLRVDFSTPPESQTRPQMQNRSRSRRY
ncbi:hypothetical protein MCOR25_005457 [Pyricularia grisea]|uniref:RRM domain-containing protein n=1 Tax=Pyricularia grisea TaxID=148305 RepID=A0A6P8BEZ0_PYRGI|nr:uncharacterized protein PgNI_05003 [Pyricularia grisea]KAI6365163.1 hypothetical protein MCOR25_005457 [Pyricularia grisea]TLD14272.1 hypothetical protein PgNI_05003 [Pyricularia grisea]